jgi:hypothetical protein
MAVKCMTSISKTILFDVVDNIVLESIFSSKDGKKPPTNLVIFLVFENMVDKSNLLISKHYMKSYMLKRIERIEFVAKQQSFG